MTVKQFFKSNVFKCLATLLCVLLISGIFLTIMNALLAVTPEEKFQRAISKIYGKNVNTKTVDVAQFNDNAVIEEAYLVTEDGNYLVKSTGKYGFDNGTVTCWVVVNVAGGAVKGVDKVVIDSNKGQSYIGNISDNFLQGFYGNYENGYAFDPNDGFIKTGATRSANAICNAVNGAIDYVNGKFLGNVASDAYSGLKYTEYIETKSTSHEGDKNGNVIFHVVTKGYGMATAFHIDITVDRTGVIVDYKITHNGTDNYDPNKMHSGILDGTLFVGNGISDIVRLANEGMEYSGIGSDLKTGATNSNFVCLYAAAFAAENYGKFLPEEVEQPDGGDSGDNGEGGNA